MSRIASGMQPSIRRGSLMRYKTLWEGSNQAQADGLLAWERVLRAQAQQPDMDEAITKRVDHLNSAPLEDTELDNLTDQFIRLQNDIRTTLAEEQAAPTPQQQFLTAAEPNIDGRHFAGLRDSLRGCAEPPNKPSSSSSCSVITPAEPSPSRIPVRGGRMPPQSFAQHAAAVSALSSKTHAVSAFAPAASSGLPTPMLFRAEPPAEFQHRAVDEAVGRGVDRLLTEGATEAGPEVGSNPHVLLRRETARSEALRREIERVRETNEALRAETGGATEAAPEKPPSQAHMLLRRETARSEALRREIERVRESNEALRAEVDGEPTSATAAGLEEDIADATVREQLVCRRPAEPALCL